MRHNGLQESLDLRDPFGQPDDEVGPQKWNHLTLVKTQHMLELANIKGALVEAFGTLFWEAVTYHDQELFDWLCWQVRTSAAIGGRRGDQLVQVMTAEREARMNLARAMTPVVTTQPQEVAKR